MELKILLIDDHPVFTDYYKSQFEEISKKIEIKATNTLEDAYNILFSNGNNCFDLVILDISMPAFHEKNINDGEDLAILIREKLPKMKIVFVTGYSSDLKLKSVLLKIMPEGYINKSDISFDNFLPMINKIIAGETYRSKFIRKILSEIMSDEFYLDKTNRQIIILIAQGISTKNLHKHLQISTSAIDKRKSKIKQLFNISFGNDENILFEARKRNII
jgi:two-component system, NarL family, response regulator NreC